MRRKHAQNGLDFHFNVIYIDLRFTLRGCFFRKQIQAELEHVHVKLRDYEELEQACQFLHDNGVLLHYDDPSLSGLYFLDPQWLCDMLAHVVTIRDVNPLVQNGELGNFPSVTASGVEGR